MKDVEASCRIKDLEVAELKKIRKDVVRRTRDYEKLYALVKNQRNKFVNLIQVRWIARCCRLAQFACSIVQQGASCPTPTKIQNIPPGLADFRLRTKA